MTEDSTFDLDEVRRLAEETEATATSDDHSVSATVKPGFKVREVNYSQRAFRLGSEELSELTLTMIKQANKQSENELSEHVRRMRG
ncbi:YbaB/EbfC family nucleoid-associated protein [Haloglycomyces albus]|uniref:YbaB/EbfC family nucleoid-associated protein n=1 Tax=Haloglycomyces albus TaxID=526067 RepID=UPI00046D3E73|nr:YbaB/EbfC family nucleoid-associated protein [Haloglycomyces albus]